MKPPNTLPYGFPNPEEVQRCYYLFEGTNIDLPAVWKFEKSLPNFIVGTLRNGTYLCSVPKRENVYKKMWMSGKEVRCVNLKELDNLDIHTYFLGQLKNTKKLKRGYIKSITKWDAYQDIPTEYSEYKFNKKTKTVVPHGKYIEYSPSGSIFIEGQCRLGKKHGRWNFYIDNKPRESVRFKNNSLHGDAYIFDKAGKLTFKSRFVNGEIRGWCTRYDKDERPAAQRCVDKFGEVKVNFGFGRPFQVSGSFPRAAMALCLMEKENIRKHYSLYSIVRTRKDPYFHVTEIIRGTKKEQENDDVPFEDLPEMGAVVVASN